MALSTYTELKASIADWLRRTDLTNQIADFITLAEAQMNRRLRVSPMVIVATASIADEYSATPDDLLEPLSMTLTNGSKRSLSLVSQQRLDALAISATDEAEPESYAVVGTQYRYYPVPDQTYTATHTYWGKIPALSATNETNWLLDSHPDAYLYGALLQSAPYLKLDERIQTWSALYLAALEDIRNSYRVTDQTTLRVDPVMMLTRGASYDINRG